VLLILTAAIMSQSSVWSLRDEIHTTLPAVHAISPAQRHRQVTAQQLKTASRHLGHASPNILPFVRAAAIQTPPSLSPTLTSSPSTTAEVLSFPLGMSESPTTAPVILAPHASVVTLSPTPTPRPRTLHDQFHAHFVQSVRPDQAMCYLSYDFGMLDTWNKQALEMCLPRANADLTRATSITCRKWFAMLLQCDNWQVCMSVHLICHASFS
jgi:hypothetical protein